MGGNAQNTCTALESGNIFSLDKNENQTMENISIIKKNRYNGVCGYWNDVLQIKAKTAIVLMGQYFGSQIM